MGVNNRRQLARTCKKHGLLVQPNALNALTREMESRGDRFSDFLDAIKETLSKTSGSKLVSQKVVELVLQEEDDELQKEIERVHSSKKRKPVVLRSEADEENVENSQTSSSSNNNNNNKPTADLFRVQPRKAKPKSKPSASRNANANNTSNKPWRLVPAFDAPRLVYDSMGKQFHYEYAKKSILGTAQDLMDMRIQRYELVQQKVDRQREHQRLPPLTTIDRLLGAGAARQERTLLGMLRSNPSLGCLELEDPTGCVPLRIDAASALFSDHPATTIDTSGIYLEGSMVLATGIPEDSECYLADAEGDALGSVFRCTSIELPPLEAKTETQPSLPPSPYARDFSHQSSRKHGLQTPVPIYSLSNLSLDEEACLQRVSDVLDRMLYETSGSETNHNNDGSGSSGIGAILVLFGNFRTETSTTASALDELARLLRDKDLPSTRHSVLLVPGPGDVGSNACWPLPAWRQQQVPSSLQTMLASEGNPNGTVHLCTNPCRLEFSDGRTVVLLRKDLIRESLRHQVLAHADRGPNLPHLASRVFYHAMSQCHLSPSSSSQLGASASPIYWNYDHAFGMVPLPDLVVLGLDEEFLEDGAHYGRAGCRFVAPLANPSRDEWQCSVTTLGRRKDKIYVEFDNGDDDDDDDEEEEMEVPEEEEAMQNPEIEDQEMQDVQGGGENDLPATEPSQTEEEIYENYRVLAGTQDTQLSQTQQLSAY